MSSKKKRKGISAFDESKPKRTPVFTKVARMIDSRTMSSRTKRKGMPVSLSDDCLDEEMDAKQAWVIEGRLHKFKPHESMLDNSSESSDGTTHDHAYYMGKQRKLIHDLSDASKKLGEYYNIPTFQERRLCKNQIKEIFSLDNEFAENDDDLNSNEYTPLSFSQYCMECHHKPCFWLQIRRKVIPMIPLLLTMDYMLRIGIMKRIKKSYMKERSTTFERRSAKILGITDESQVITHSLKLFWMRMMLPLYMEAMDNGDTDLKSWNMNEIVLKYIFVQWKGRFYSSKLRNFPQCVQCPLHNKLERIRGNPQLDKHFDILAGPPPYPHSGSYKYWQL